MARRKKQDKPAVNKKDNKEEKLTAVNIAMQQIDERFGSGSIMKLSKEYVNKKIPSASTGCISLDLALGIGGLPYGRIIEIFGPEASGKTTLCLHVIAEVQKKGGVAAFIDVEHALDPQRAKDIGVHTDELLLSQPDTGEQALEITETLIRSGGVDIVVIDSVAALVPKAELEGEMGDSIIGLQARLMSQAMRKLAGSINKSKCMIIFTNQLREKIGVMFGNPEVTPGGRALKFYSSIRIDLRKIGNIQDGDVIIGSRHRAKVVKNKVAPPFRITEFDILNEGGISHLGSLIDEAINQEVIQKSGAFLKYQGKVIAQGREATRKILKAQPKMAHKIEKEIWEKINNG